MGVLACCPPYGQSDGQSVSGLYGGSWCVGLALFALVDPSLTRGIVRARGVLAAVWISPGVLGTGGAQGVLGICVRGESIHGVGPLLVRCTGQLLSTASLPCYIAQTMPFCELSNEILPKSCVLTG